MNNEMNNEKKILLHTGDVLYHEKAYEDWMYEIVSGQIGIYIDYGTENERKLMVISEGYLGVMDMIDSMPRTVTAVAETEAEVIRIDYEEMNSYFVNNPEKIRKMMFMMINRLDRMNELYLEICNTAREYLEAHDQDTPKSDALMGSVVKYSNIFRWRSNRISR